MKYLSNAFSLQMLSLEQATSVNIQPVTAAEVPADCIGAIGHADTARVVSYDEDLRDLMKGREACLFAN